MLSSELEHQVYKQQRQARLTASVYAWIPMVILGLCSLLFLFMPQHSQPPTSITPEFDSALLSTDPLRTPLGNPPMSKINGFMRDCQDCHEIFKSAQNHNDGEEQHRHIHLQHGLNDDCLNCHSDADRNKLQLHGNKTVDFDQSEMLCAQCHGTTYRDWRNGSHGRVQGSWLSYSEDRTSLTCVACHDPHKPSFPGIKPLPGPQTLRMSPSSGYRQHYRSSLMQWLNDDDQDSSDDDSNHNEHNEKEHDDE